ncbi:hypothetical protein H6P81_020181 [Aristolochia fimbriata]|uniref:Uncharacterized protein n=1 Tax=Aristolochia fimbriata TaxID=158543 RepID=A0AAV7DUW7_ARIFI|nr:hypothetical protein H6P81_020181 [Aristolochia fimbriata]
MFRQASRNQRSKGLKVKHVVQICLLLAVCFWLLYQVKHSHDKKKAFDESNAKLSVNLQQRDDILKFGRKDLNERDGVSTSVIEQQHVDEENEEEDENKHEEAEDEGREDERRGGGDDEIDERDQEKSIEESGHREEFEDEEKDEEEIKEKEEKEEEEPGKQENEEEEEKKENEEEAEKKEHEEGEENKEIAENEDSEERKENSHEAREAQYNGDDASSAVVKERVNVEGENVDLGTSINEQRDNPERDSPEVGSKINATIDSSVDQNGGNSSSMLETSKENDNPERDAVGSDSKAIAMVDSSFNQTSSLMDTVEKHAENGTGTQEKVGDVGSSVTGIETLSSPTLEKEVDNVTLSNSSQENESKGGETKLQNLGNETLSHSPTESSGQVVAENLGNATTHVEPDQHQNMTLGTETTTDVADPDRQSVLPELTERSNSTKGEGENQIADKNTPSEIGDGLNGNSTDARGGLESDKNLTSSILDENSDKLLVESTDTNSSSVTQEVKEALTDLRTLPGTGIEGNTENVAAE